jgi:hypothetical protein
MSKEEDLVRLADQAGAAFAGGRQFFVARLRSGIQWRTGSLAEIAEWGEARR